MHPPVGRDALLAAVGAAVDEVSGGAGRVLLLSGVAGIGKTRPARAALNLAAKRGFRVLSGAAGPHHLDPAYAPLVVALRPLVGRDALARRPRLLDGLGRLGLLFDELPVEVPAPLPDAGLERLRLFEAVWGLLDRVTRLEPVALLVDDLHWADPATVALLAHLVRGLARRRFLLVVTCRLEEAPADLRDVLAGLRSL